jgi:hypothetical protein
MILIYAHTTSYRLQYICQFIFKEQLGIQYSLTLNKEGFDDYEGPKINYSRLSFDDKHRHVGIKPYELLFEQEIKAQEITCFDAGGFKAFFKADGQEYPFDIFAASFYLLTRYEEYLPHEKDSYGRYAHTNSVAFKEQFLDKPLINIWVNHFAAFLKEKFHDLQFHFQPFSFLPTYDIDIAYSYRSKGLLRNAGGLLRSPSLERLKVLFGFQKDPFDAYDFLDELHREWRLHPVYFFLVAEKTGRYDKNISPNKKIMIKLISNHAKRYSLGIHPSWKSNESLSALLDEKNYLEDLCQMQINNSRQHYIRFKLPDTLENLLEAGIINEFSMGYGSINGFRASVASSYYWYNLKSDRQTALRLHPFCYMDANSYYEQKQSASESYKELMHYYSVCKEVNGCMITIFHNHFLGSDKKFREWKEMYRQFIAQLQQ